MNQMKTRLAALTLLDRAFQAMSDDDLSTVIESLPDGHVASLDAIADGPKDGFTDPAARITALRVAAARGRIGGQLEQICTVLTDPALADCITALGDHADHPTEEQLLAVTPELVDKHGVPAIRLMMASAVVGEAAASPMLIGLLKNEGEFALPAVQAREVEVLAPKVVSDDIKAKRQAAKDAKKAAARARREQQARAGHRG
jgi:hypothetical protein